MVKFFMNKFLCAVLFFLQTHLAAAATCSQIPVSNIDQEIKTNYCISQFNAFKTALNYSANPAVQAGNCLKACDPALLCFTNATLVEKMNACSGTSSNGTSCQDFDQKIKDKVELTDEDLQQCVDNCNTAKSNATLSTDKSKYAATSKSCSDKLASTAVPLPPDDSGSGSGGEQVPIDESGNAEPVTTSTSPTTEAGYPNPQLLQSALQGLSTPIPIIPNNGSGGMVNFTGGPSGNRDVYSGVGSGIQGGNGPGPSGIFAKPVIDDNFNPSEVKKVDAQGGSPSGGGGATPASASNMGGSRAGGGGGGGGAAGGGGARTSIAGTQLGKVGQSSFYNGGGSLATAPNGSRKPATPATAKAPPYVPKNAAGDGGLNRLFSSTSNDMRKGQNSQPANYWNQTCSDTVFCSVESFFSTGSRSTASDVNPALLGNGK